ncbi:MAG: DMT family transporter [Chloroflexi bacterium]|nr:DMT family transporter [Chloroflexota bacterium]
MAVAGPGRVSWENRREVLRKTRERAGFLYTMSSVVVYGLMPALVRLIYDASELSALQASFWRFALAAPVLWLLALRSHPNHHPFSPRARASLWRTVFVGIFYGLTSVLAFQSLLYIPAAVFIILFYTFPIIVVSVARILGERLPRVFWLALILTLGGVALTAIAELSGAGEVDAVDERSLLGVLLALASALAVALYFTVNQRILRGHGGVTRGVVWILTSASVTLFVVAQLTGEGIGLDAIGDAWALLLFFGVCSTSFSVYMLNLGIQRLGAARASVVATSEPIFTLFFAWLLLGEWLQLPQFIGGALILAGVVLLTWRQMRAGVTGGSA